MSEMTVDCHTKTIMCKVLFEISTCLKNVLTTKELSSSDVFNYMDSPRKDSINCIKRRYGMLL